jgi:hypothetical protein
MADYDITVTVPNQGPPGPQGPPGITDASLLDSGTLADARLSTNVPLKDASNTFTQNQTLDGTNNVAPNQTAASGSSIMTRDLVRSFHRNTIAPFFFETTTHLFESGTANSGTANTSGHFARVHTSASVLGSVAWHDILGRAGSPINFSNAGAGGSNLDWRLPFQISFIFIRTASSTNTSLDFRITTTTTAPAYTVPNSETGVGWKMSAVSSATNTATFQSFSADGTTATFASAVTNSPLGEVSPFRATYDGTTNITFEYYTTTNGWINIGTVAKPITTIGNFRVRFAAINDGAVAQRCDYLIQGNVRFYHLNFA